MFLTWSDFWSPTWWDIGAFFAVLVVGSFVAGAVATWWEQRAKQSAAAKKFWQDPDYRAKQIAAHTGKRFTTETRAKISAALKRHNKMAK